MSVTSFGGACAERRAEEGLGGSGRTDSGFPRILHVVVGGWTCPGSSETKLPASCQVSKPAIPGLT